MTEQELIEREYMNAERVVSTLKMLLDSWEKKAKPRRPFKAIRWALAVAIEMCKKQIPQSVHNQQGTPLWGYCPSCGKQITKSSCPVGCKWCLQRVEWRDEE